MFNALCIEGLAKPLGVDAWVDSGGYKLLSESNDVKWSEDLVEHVLRVQERFGADVAFTLDYSLTPDATDVARRLDATARAAGFVYQLRTRSNMKILAVLHCRDAITLDYMLNCLSYWLHGHADMSLSDVDGFAISGLVPYSRRLPVLVERAQLLRRRVGWEPWIHVLGIASPVTILLLYLAGADSVDSKTAVMMASYRRYYIGLIRLDMNKYPRLRPRELCNCPICQHYDTFTALAEHRRHIILHNTYVFARIAQWAWANNPNNVYAVLREHAYGSPQLARALQIIDANKHDLVKRQD